MPADRPPPLPSFIAERERKAKKAAAPQKALKPDTPSAINIDRIDRNINESMRKQIVEIINKHPDLALSIVRSWKDKS